MNLQGNTRLKIVTHYDKDIFQQLVNEWLADHPVNIISIDFGANITEYSAFFLYTQKEVQP